ncbi:MAG: type II toxin-antitoxin system RelE/ParE family toxin [Oscillospiraceae bacterium]|nr:type II toxin-antitoxin system RelE/ParE family toxin [Oscillospiraceae bacterium]
MMGEYSLEILSAAQRELEEIGRLHMELVGPKSAHSITERIYTALENLCNFPHLGAVLENKRLRESGYRKLICGNYLCFYRLIGSTIFVYHIADGRSYYKVLFKSLQ